MGIPVILYFAFTAGFVEEIAFRGLPWTVIRTLTREGWGRIAVYVVLTSVMFAAIHWENGLPELIATFSFGGVSACLYLIWRTLWPLVIAHTVLNVMVLW